MFFMAFGILNLNRLVNVGTNTAVFMINFINGYKQLCVEVKLFLGG